MRRNISLSYQLLSHSLLLPTLLDSARPVSYISTNKGRRMLMFCPTGEKFAILLFELTTLKVSALPSISKLIRPIALQLHTLWLRKPCVTLWSWRLTFWPWKPSVFKYQEDGARVTRGLYSNLRPLICIFHTCCAKIPRIKSFKRVEKLRYLLLLACDHLNWTLILSTATKSTHTPNLRIVIHHHHLSNDDGLEYVVLVTWTVSSD